MSVDIVGREVAFRQVKGRQFLKHDDGEPREFDTLYDRKGGKVTVTDTVPVDEQLELAAERAVEITLEELNFITQGRFEKMLAEYGYTFVPAEDEKISCYPHLTNIKWNHHSYGKPYVSKSRGDDRSGAD